MTGCRLILVGDPSAQYMVYAIAIYSYSIVLLHGTLLGWLAATYIYSSLARRIHIISISRFLSVSKDIDIHGSYTPAAIYVVLLLHSSY